MIDLREFNRLLFQIVENYQGTQTLLAQQIGVHPTRISKWLYEEEAAVGPGIEYCLRLADVSFTPPSRLLAAAGYGDIADIIERLYGDSPARPLPTLSPEEAEHLRLYRSMDAATRRAMRTVVRTIADPFARHGNTLANLVKRKTRRNIARGRGGVDVAVDTGDAGALRAGDCDGPDDSDGSGTRRSPDGAERI